jgi:hypothetical protein
MYTALYVKYPFFVSDFNETSILSTYFRKKYKISNFMKIRPMGAQFRWADGQTDGRKDGQTEKTRLSVAFRNFAYAPKYYRMEANRSYKPVKLNSKCCTP